MIALFTLATGYYLGLSIALLLENKAMKEELRCLK